MTVAIGIFEKEEGVLEAIKRFQATRTNEHNLRIVVKNKESAPLLAAETNTPIEEVYEIREAQELNNARVVTPIGVAPFAAGGYTPGSTGVNGNPAGIVAGAAELDQGLSNKDVLHDIGIPDKHTKECGEAIEQGRYLLVADTDSETAAEALLLQSGAYKVIY
ncbi:hypothetical protein [Bacillus sp. FJAT-28004]|uniref:hypothetical protein n=1 Tax=Bacillus sp. FJAT-28004 TaxID=1679165 RepID=UPI0006B62989|nr:hypothetical protein [Bacillus sp. FJAT-28004]